MDLEEALHVVDTPVRLSGRSDEALVRAIQQRKDFSPPRKALSPAIGLEDGIVLRPIEALHRLASATRPRYQDDVLDRYLWWGLLRYLGFFAREYSHPGVPKLVLSEAGRRIVGNQRRVTSEEMGIGFGTALAARWFETTSRAGLRSVVDIDVALDARFVFGPDVTAQHIGTRRPDYLLIGTDPQDSSRYATRVLECKGTKSTSTAMAQLARGVGQLDGVEIGGRVPDGLATAVVTGESGTSYLAIDPGEDEEPFYEVSTESIQSVRGFRLESDQANVPAADMTSAAVSASWAVLADFGGNFEALQQWAPEVMQGRLRRQPRERVTFETPVGSARGTSIDFGFGQEQLTVQYGIDQQVDRALAGDFAEPVMEAQQAFATRLQRFQTQNGTSGPRTVYSATPDGSIFSLTMDD
ncbi:MULTISPECIES: hypothetical protein [Amycolatopsis]|uniref:Uncharacterized protein n=1 Tax=Amycolatopsis bullii TaxID=941987 RepID=A0ABQ3KIJ8_9PSEU|nr:hypothetical protein [Amycolatopsis bullii]GHG21542.1 hypothetical protein GCM10017567_45350 [Amycolatopsis bullii]